jgi:dihydrolipoamide dehydrogenase
MYDLIIIGGGPGGYTAAIKAAQNNLSVALVESHKVGGVCLNWGCIPTKSMLHSAHIYHSFESNKSRGISGNISFDFAKIVEHSQSTIKKLHSGIHSLLAKYKNNITFINGVGSLLDKNMVLVSCIPNVESESTAKTLEISGNNIIIAAESSSIAPFGTSNRIWTAKEGSNPPFFPRKILIVGAGAIGCEYASLFSMLKSEVTLIEFADNILMGSDEFIQEIIKKKFLSDGISISTNISVKNTKESKNSVEVELSDSSKEKYDAVLFAIGTSGNGDSINPSIAGIECKNGRFDTNLNHQTNVDNIYAIGDISTRGPFVAHKSSFEGIQAVNHILGNKISSSAIPMCIYTYPGVASIGLTERECKDKGISTRIGIFNFSNSGKAIAQADDNGPVGGIKTIFEKETGEFLGCHMVGDSVTEIISSLGIAHKLEATDEELAKIIFPHPTISESILESVLISLGIGIHG